MIQSGGELVLADATPMRSPTYYGRTGIALTDLFSSYGEIYRRQLWVYVLVNKRAKATARLPLKVYQRTATGREVAVDSAYARLLREPSPRISARALWNWTRSTIDIYGEAMWAKIRDRADVPAQLVPIHPTNVVVSTKGSELVYEFTARIGTEPFTISQRDMVHFRTYNPDTLNRGLSPLEPLRQTLLNEDSARRATSAFWRNGGRPSVSLTHPMQLSPEAKDRISLDWASLHGGVDNFGKAVVLEEGMVPNLMSLNVEEAQYIETRKLNREEACAVYDMPPPAVHILDRATYSNITENLRSLYRDTMAPIVGELEDELEFQLRPDFSDESLYAEFSMDEVLRGTPEERADSLQKNINSGLMTPNEGRALENRPPMEGGDRLLINSTLVPLEEASRKNAPTATVSASLTTSELRTLHGRLSRAKSLDDVDADHLVAGLNGHADEVRAALADSIEAGESVPGFRDLLRSFVAEPDPVLEMARSVAALAAREQPAPVVTVEAPQITIAAPPAPPPANVSVEVHGNGAVRRTVERDDDGNIVAVVEEPDGQPVP